MPFERKFQPLYEDHIKTVAKELAMSVARGDDFFTTQAIIGEVWSAIAQSKIVIADCTDRNPNVFYEIGIAHAIGKPVILITQNVEDIPFDLRHLRHIKYEYTPRGVKEFERRLKTTLLDW
jgi:nucleoside 2-deoxyribosyltransferase